MSRSLVWLALLASRSAAASPVQYEGGVCDRAVLAHRLDALGITGAFDDDTDPVVRIVVTAGSDDMVANVSLLSDGTTRAIDEPDCDHLADALAIVIGVALAEHPFTPAPPLPFEDPVPAPPPPEPEPAPAISERWLVAGGEVSLDDSIGFVAGARLRKGWASIGLELEPYTWRALDQVGNAMHAPAEISLALTAARIVPCAHYGAVAACALLSGGAMRVHPEGLTPDRSELTAFAAAGLRAALEYPVSERLALELHADARANLLRTQIAIDGMSTSTAPAIDAVLGCAVSGRFP